MSEYQYYEFRAIDRRLTEAERVKLRTFSSRAEITATTFVVEYNFGDFKGNPDDWMMRWFDAFVYMANWGSNQFMLGFPAGALPESALAPYLVEYALSVKTSETRSVLTWESELEGGDGSEVGALGLSDLLRIRDGLMAGDFRALYLGWLAGLWEMDDREEVCEPPVPPGMDRLDASLQCLAEFLRIDAHLLAVAVDPAPPDAGKRTAASLLAAGEAREKKEAERLRKAREAKTNASAKAAAAKRLQFLQAQTPHYDTLWMQVYVDIDTRLPKNYAAAVQCLVDLRDIASMTGRESTFARQLTDLLNIHERKPNLIGRIRDAGLIA